MSFRSIRRFDVQATYAWTLAMASVVPLLGSVALLVRNYNSDLGQIIYGARGAFLGYFLGCLALSVTPGVLAFFLGWSSAGQRRNDRPRRSWVGFFLGGLVVTVNVILFLTFWMLKLRQTG